MLEERLRDVLKQFKLVPESHIDYTLGKLLQAIKEAGYLSREEWGKHVDEAVVENPHVIFSSDSDKVFYEKLGKKHAFIDGVQAAKEAIKGE